MGTRGYKIQQHPSALSPSAAVVPIKYVPSSAVYYLALEGIFLNGTPRVILKKNGHP